MNKSKYTQFGKYMRILRTRNGEKMKDMAQKLNISIPFLSSVENGQKNVPQKWFSIIAEHYSLNKKEIQQMRLAANNSKTQIKLTLCNTEQYQRELAIQFASSIANMDEKTAKEIIKILKKEV